MIKSSIEKCEVVKPQKNNIMPEKGTKSTKWRLIINLDEKVLGELE
jgi:predicted transcriptional regulator of viral defense system